MKYILFLFLVVLLISLTNAEYQENADETNCNNSCCDGNYATYGDFGEYYFNYSINDRAYPIWQIKQRLDIKFNDTGVGNITLPDSCWDNEKLQLRVRVNESIFDYSCWNGNSWRVLHGPSMAGNRRFYEEGVFWDTRSYGPNLIKNGDFSYDSDWIKGEHWLINTTGYYITMVSPFDKEMSYQGSGYAYRGSHDGSVSSLEQNINIIPGKRYKIRLIIPTWLNSGPHIELGGVDTGQLPWSKWASYEITAISNEGIKIWASDYFSSSFTQIDEVSVREIEPLSLTIKYKSKNYTVSDSEDVHLYMENNNLVVDFDKKSSLLEFVSGLIKKLIGKKI